MKKSTKREEPFDAESFFETKTGQESIRSQGVVLDFTAAPFKRKRVKIEKGLSRVCREKYRYEDFHEINRFHSAYIEELKGHLGPDAFLPILWQAEMTGAIITIGGREGVVVEERKNSLLVIFKNNKVKLFPKEVWDFSFQFQDKTYFFYSKNLKHNRTTK
ncbi:hypothetical protein PAEPH01_0088 [Pancytospora epiphaga]|nr:hypothetical protein PAEPH01_0088 [Pancytospora epiphaga]